MEYKGITATSPSEVCELFSNYFSTVFESINPTSDSLTEFSSGVPCNSTLSHIHITHEVILKKIKNLDPNKGAGPDGVPAMLIIKCAKEISLPLKILFNDSITSGTFPKAWKIAYVVPVFKSGDRNDCTNYRPISILSCLAKLFESVVYDVLYNHVKPLLHDQQHGFVANKSTTSNLLEYKNYLCRAFAKRLQVDSIYTDFSKAFDKVNHVVLAKKLENFGVHGCLLRWFQSYLGLRSQLVALRGHTSCPVSATSGIPQGSHLGPLLFIMFINDLIDVLSCPCLLYADDLKVFSTIGNTMDASKLQSDLDSISDWCKKNFMRLNAGKCFVISFTTRKNKLLYQYSLHGDVLSRTDNARDLGVIFDSKLTFKCHYNSITKRCFSLLGFIARTTKHFKQSRSLIYIYYMLVRSILEYGSSVWFPIYKVHNKEIEAVQEKFLRMLSYRHGLGRTLSTYDDRLKYFYVESLQSRRQRSDLVLLHKVVNHQLDSPSVLSQININTRYSRNFNIFSLQVFTNNTSYYNPIVRMCRQYNQAQASNSSLDIFHQTEIQFRRQLRLMSS